MVQMVQRSMCRWVGQGQGKETLPDRAKHRMQAVEQDQPRLSEGLVVPEERWVLLRHHHLDQRDPMQVV